MGNSLDSMMKSKTVRSDRLKNQPLLETDFQHAIPQSNIVNHRQLEFVR